MRRSDLTISLITDEVSPSLDEGLAFARAEGIGTVDLRVVDGRNVLALSRPELTETARRVRAAGLEVSCICTPLLKWSPPGKASQTKGDQFGFELGDRPPRDVYAEAFAAAEILGARHLRIFSYLAYDGYRVDDLRGPMDDLLALAEKFDMKLHVENEGVCNIAGFAELETLVTAYRHPRLRALPDIANAFIRSMPPSAADLAAAAAVQRYAAHQGLRQGGRPLRRRGRGRRPARAAAGGDAAFTRRAADADDRDACPLRARRHHAAIDPRAAPHDRRDRARLSDANKKSGGQQWQLQAHKQPADR